MNATTGIEWTDATSNPVKYRDKATGAVVWACVKKSPGCANCYSETLAKRYGRGGPFTKAEMAKVEPFLCEKECGQLLRSKKLAGKRMFLGDMTDIFGEWVSDDILNRLFSNVLEPRTDVTFQLLTKRADRMKSYLSWRWGEGRIPARNIWCGVSVEDQTRADERIPLLLQTPAAVRFLSCEPLLSAVDVSRWLRPGASHHLCVSVSGALKNGDLDGFRSDDGRPMSRAEARAELERLQATGVKVIPMGECDGFSDQTGCPGHRQAGIDWLIVGGESGPGARPCLLEWVGSVVRQCREAGVPAFVKQLGSTPRALTGTGVAEMIQLGDRKGGDPSEWPAGLNVRQFPEPARA